MDLTSLFPVAGKAFGSIVSSITGRSKIHISVQHIEEIHSYIVEVKYIGLRPTSITAVGLSGRSGHYSTGYINHIWMADDPLPKKLRDGEVAYFLVWWGSDVEGRGHAIHAWVRDTSGKVTRIRLPESRPLAATADRVPIAEAERARLFNLAVLNERLSEEATRIAPLEAGVAVYVRAAQVRIQDEDRKRGLREGTDEN